LEKGGEEKNDEMDDQVEEEQEEGGRKMGRGRMDSGFRSRTKLTMMWWMRRIGRRSR
jgi:hypothetical protein